MRRPIQHLFLFIGAEPNTDWLSGSGVALDAKGFVLTGGDCNETRNPLETSRNGIFAIGDVRSGSIKRVAAAVGEGAQEVAITPLWPRWRARYRVSQLRSVADGQASPTFVPHSPQFGTMHAFARRYEENVRFQFLSLRHPPKRSRFSAARTSFMRARV